MVTVFKNVIYRLHALQRMFEREISDAEVNEVLINGTCIEDYPDDTPYPSQLILGFANEKAIHVVLANIVLENETVIITVYSPEAKKWTADFKTRLIK